MGTYAIWLWSGLLASSLAAAQSVDDRAELTRLLRVGSDRARSVASKTLTRAYDAIGLIPA